MTVTVDAVRRSTNLFVWLLALALVASTYFAYHESLSFAFLNLDDPEYVTANARVQSGLTADNVKWAMTTGYFANWHPMVWLSYMADSQIFGLDPGAFHAVNLALHLINTALLFLILRKATGATICSFLVAAFFGVHPLHCESVTWVAERKDLLSTLFGLLAIEAYFRYTARPDAWHRAVVTAFLALGLMSKAMLITWPFVFLFLDLWPLRRVTFPLSFRALQPLLTEKIVWCIMAGATGVVSLLVQDTVSFRVLALHDRLANAGVAYSRYLGKLFMPRDLAIFYPYSTAGFGVSDIVLAGSVLVGLSALAFITRRTRPYIAFGWLWYLVTLLPVIGILQIGGQAMADRYTYIPSIGIFVMVAWAGADLTLPFRRLQPLLALLAIGILIPLLSWSTLIQNRHWKDSCSLFEHAIRVTKDNAFAEKFLGRALVQRGKPDEALPHFQRSLEILPGDPEGAVDLGTALTLLGRHEESVRVYQFGLTHNPGHAALHMNLANCMVRTGRFAEAYEHYSAAISREPHSPVLHYNMGRYFEMAGQWDRAIRHYQEAGRLSPDLLKAAQSSIQRIQAAKARPSNAK